MTAPLDDTRAAALIAVFPPAGCQFGRHRGTMRSRRENGTETGKRLALSPLTTRGKEGDTERERERGGERERERTRERERERERGEGGRKGGREGR